MGETVPVHAQSQGIGVLVLHRGTWSPSFHPTPAIKGRSTRAADPKFGDPIEALHQAWDTTQLAATYAASLPAGALRPELGAYGPVITSTLDELHGLLNTLSRASREQPGFAETTQLVDLQHALGIAVVIAHRS